MRAFWVSFETGTNQCVEAESAEDAMRIASEITSIKATGVKVLPYPADPRLNRVKQQDSRGNDFVTPSFCFRPDQCCGRTACPQRYSCTE